MLCHYNPLIAFIDPNPREPRGALLAQRDQFIDLMMVLDIGSGHLDGDE